MTMTMTMTRLTFLALTLTSSALGGCAGDLDDTDYEGEDVGMASSAVSQSTTYPSPNTTNRNCPGTYPDWRDGSPYLSSNTRCNTENFSPYNIGAHPRAFAKCTISPADYVAAGQTRACNIVLSGGVTYGINGGWTAVGSPVTSYTAKSYVMIGLTANQFVSAQAVLGVHVGGNTPKAELHSAL